MEFREAIELFGSQTNMAQSLGVSRQATTKWRRDGIPPLRQYQIESLSKGSLKAESLPTTSLLTSTVGLAE
jgi:DNA-binding transcriptional regulator YdaS (Cro superfamily)